MDADKPKVSWINTNYNLAKKYENRSWQDILLSKKFDRCINTCDILFDYFDKPDMCAYNSSGRKLEEELKKQNIDLFPCLELLGDNTQRIHVATPQPEDGRLANSGAGVSGMETEDFVNLILLKNAGMSGRLIQRRNPNIKHIGTIVNYDSNEGKYNSLKESLKPHFQIQETFVIFPYRKY